MFIKIGPLVLNEAFIESVAMDVEFKGEIVTVVRMNRNHQRKDGANVVVSYTFKGESADAVKSYFNGEMLNYPGFGGRVFDLALGYKNIKRGMMEREFEGIEQKVERAKIVGVEEKRSVPGMPRLDLSKIKGGKVVDIGCGNGFLLKMLDDGKRTLYGFDLSKEGAEQAKRRVPAAVIKVGDAHHITFADETFDYTVSTEFLEHVEDPENVLSELVS